MNSTAGQIQAPHYPPPPSSSHHHPSTYDTAPTIPTTPASISASAIASSTDNSSNTQLSSSPRVITKEPSEPEISLHCQSQHEVQLELEKLIKKQQNALIPEPVWCQFMLHTGATFSIESDNSSGNNGLAGGDESEKSALNEGQLGTTPRAVNGTDFKPSKIAISLTEVLDVSKEDKKRYEVQIAVSRAIVTALEEVDGFRYTRRNSWETKARDGLRLSYVCSESLQNHDRAANRLRKRSSAVADSPAVFPSESGNGAGKDESQLDKRDVSNGNQRMDCTIVNMQNNSSSYGMEKHPTSKPLPTFDCRGNVMVKFLALQQCIVVVYRHNPIHRKVSRRAEEEFTAVGQTAGSGIAAVEKPKRKRAKNIDGR